MGDARGRRGRQWIELRNTRPADELRWYVVQRFNAATRSLEPPSCDVDHGHVVARDALARRIEHVAPGEAPFSTVPQIFHDGCYIGGYADLCAAIALAPAIAELFVRVPADKLPAMTAETWCPPSPRRGERAGCAPSPRALAAVFEAPR